MAMPCPKCKEKKTGVRETRGAKRTRLCFACGNIFITEEVFEEDLKRLRLWHGRYAKLVEAIDTVVAAASFPIPPHRQD